MANLIAYTRRHVPLRRRKDWPAIILDAICPLSGVLVDIFLFWYVVKLFIYIQQILHSQSSCNLKTFSTQPCHWVSRVSRKRWDSTKQTNFTAWWIYLLIDWVTECSMTILSVINKLVGLIDWLDWPGFIVVGFFTLQNHTAHVYHSSFLTMIWTRDTNNSPDCRGVKSIRYLFQRSKQLAGWYHWLGLEIPPCVRIPCILIKQGEAQRLLVHHN